MGNYVLKIGAALGLFAILFTAIVAVTFDQAHPRIEANERLALLEKLNTLIPPSQFDNDLTEDTIEVIAQEELGAKQPVKVYRARLAGKPVAAVFTPVVAPDGYSGPIKLLVAVRFDGTLAGVRVLAHRETPGLGDPIEETRSEWIYHFNDRSLSVPSAKEWKVKKDGGVFDQFTGATITPRAVVKAVYNCLQYFATNRERIFEQSAPAIPK